MKRDLVHDNTSNDLASRIAALAPEKRTLMVHIRTRKLADGHTLVAQSLRRLGITHVYCVSGTPIRETFAKCGELGIRLIGVRHQQAGVMMAIAQNYVSGRLIAISILSAGPAVTNAATSILVARDNCWPVIVLGGRRPLTMQGMGSFQELDSIPMYKPITKWSALVEATSAIPDYLDRAFKIAVSGRPGPVYLDLPEDILTGLASPSDLFFPESDHCSAADVDASMQAADVLLSAERPAIVIGKGVRWSAPYEELTRLVNEHAIPFITSPMGHGYLPDDHPLCYNDGRHVLMSRADAVLLLGARLDWSFRFGSELGPDVKLIQIDIHASEIGINKTPTVGIVGDVKKVLQQILTFMERKVDRYQKSDLAAWHAALSEERAGKRLKLESLMNTQSLPMTPHRMLKEIRDFLPRDAICVLDGNVFMAAAQQVLPTYSPASRLTAGSNGCLGVGIPFGIGAKLAHPDRLVIVICGDTAFGFNAMDMETAVRHGVAVIIVVVNNDGNCGALMQKTYFHGGGERITMYQPGIQYEAIMRAFGGHAEFVDRPEQLKLALTRAVASGKAACVNVQVDPNAPYPRD
ncbi:MAG TPA: thiamine pyrophosphate-binding protein [Candidatus Binatia bacterium]|jgi:2-hydroxyacyl-CoA lyase 1